MYGWEIKGQKIVKEINTIRKRYTLICAITNKKVLHYKTISGSSNALIFKEFLEELFAKGIENKYLLLDNARIHHSKIVKEYIDQSSNKLVFNVPYSPEYNPIEMVFSKIKTLIRKKSNNKLPKNLLNNIRIAINKIKSIDLKHFYEKALPF